MLKTLSLALSVIFAVMALAAPAFADADTQTGETHDCIYKQIVLDHPELFAGGIKKAALLGNPSSIFNVPSSNTQRRQ